MALAVASATLFIFPFKVAAADGNGAGAALGLLFFTALFFSPWALFRWPRLDRRARRATFSLSWKMALAAAFGNIAQGYAFELLHPGVATTFIQMNVLFVAILGVLWLRERLTVEVGVGVLLAVSGIALTQWPALSGHFEWNVGVLWAVAAALGFSGLDLFSRRYSRGVDSVVANVQRAWLGAFLLACVPGALDQLWEMHGRQLGACALAALLGPGLARLLLISASRNLPAAETALLQQLRPPLALPLTSVVFGVWPSAWEWGGSTFVAAGVAVPLALAVLKKHQAPPSPQP